MIFPYGNTLTYDSFVWIFWGGKKYTLEQVFPSLEKITLSYNPTFNWVLLWEIVLQFQQKPQAVSKDLKGIVTVLF